MAYHGINLVAVKGKNKGKLFLGFIREEIPMNANKKHDFLITEYKIDNAIVRMHDPHQTPEEKEQWKNRLEEATGRFLQRVVAQRWRQKKQ